MVENVIITIYDLLYSVTQVEQETADFVLNQLKLSNVLETDERVIMDKFLVLKDELGTIPSPSTLVSSEIGYQTARTILGEALCDMTKLFIADKNKKKFSSALLNLSMEVSKSSVKEVKEKILDIVNSTVDELSSEEEHINTVDTSIIDKMLANDVEEKGVPFGIDCIDSIYPGVRPGSVNVLAGYTGSMKTTLAVNHCFIGMQMGKNYLYFSLEVSKADIVIGLMSLYTISCTNEPINRDDMAKLKFKDKEKFRSIYEKILELPGKIQIYDETDLESYGQNAFNEIIRRTDKMFKDNFNSQLDNIVLDHAQLLKYDDAKTNRDPYQVLNIYADFFRKKAARDQYGVILLSQTSRQGYEQACKRGGAYSLTGLAESNELERGATFVAALFSSDSLKASGQIQAQVLKNRFGPTMLEPQAVSVRPEYYLIGDGYGTSPQQVSSVFEEDGTFSNPFGNLPTESLDDLLGGM